MLQFSILQHDKPILTAMKKHYLLFFLFTAFFAKAQEPFITTWEVTAGQYITIPVVYNENNSYTVDFGDGTVLTEQTGPVQHYYWDGPGTYTITLSGNFNQVQFLESTYSCFQLRTIEQWGDLQWASMEEAFLNCQSLIINATDTPDLSQVTNMSMMFKGCIAMNTPLNDWDVSNVTNMQEMFNYAINFNQPLDNWDVSNVTNMNGMFKSCTNFNQPIGNWDVSSVTTMETLFASAPQFNQPLNNWDVSNVTSMRAMFSSAIAFNQPLDSWDVSNVVNMSNMFGDAMVFNQPLGDWDVSNVQDMSYMISGAYAFDYPLQNWDVSNVTNMEGLFYGTPYNYPLESWDVSNVTNMKAMFSANTTFNHPLGDWDVSNVTDMAGMFEGALQFNQPLNEWDVSNVTNMYNMFWNAAIFNQPLNNWNVSNVTEMLGMFTLASAFNQNLSSWNFNSESDFYSFDDSGLDAFNYEAILFKFVQLGIEDGYIYANGLEYCDSGVRDHLINELNWEIMGDSLGDECLNNAVTGMIRLDYDADGCDTEDNFMDTFLVNASNGAFDYVTSVTNGQYDLNVLEDTYTVQLLNLPDYFTATPASSEITFEGFGNEETLNFCLTANEIMADLNITLLSLGEARPGFPAEYQLVVQNMGTQTVADATVTLTFDDALLTFVAASPAPASTTTSQLTFEIEDLQPLESNMIDIEMEVFAPPTVNGGEIVNFTATVIPNESDNTPADNTFVLEQEIVNSYDPNDKRVLEGEWIYEEQADGYLNYIIRFQNTGTASAITVRIEDILHENLDWATLMPVSASQDYRVEITDGNHVEFIFDNINLPHEEADEEGSNGFIAYKIRPVADVQAGDSMSGNASIFFDYNLPIITNTVTTEVIEPMEASASQTDVGCNGESNGSASVSVSEGWGDYTYSWSPSGGNEATASGLSAGEYTVTITDETGDSILVDFTITQPEPIAITTQPENDTAVAGSNAEFAIEASNVDEYQWQESTNGTDWADISNGGTAPAYSGADTDELTITNMPAGYDGYLYRAMLVNGDDCTTYSSEAELSVTEVTANTLLAVNDDFSATTILEGTGGFAGDVTANDLFNGEPANDLLIAIALTVDGGIEGVAIDSDGNLSVPATALDGTYTVTYSICEAADDTNCNTATAIVVVTAVAGVAGHDAINVTLYPNPAADMLYLQAGKDILVQGIEIYNMQGRRMLSFTGESETFNISSLSAGIYMVQVKTDKGLAINKLVKN